MAVLDRYKGSLINALVHVYPSVTFNDLMINSSMLMSPLFFIFFFSFVSLYHELNYIAEHSNDYWSEPKNRRAFFMNIAAIMKFDPLVPSNWYSISKSTIKSYKVVFFSSSPSRLSLPPYPFLFHIQNVNSVLNFYNGNHVRALIQLFPEVRFSQTNFAMGMTYRITKSMRSTIDFS